MLLVVGLDAKFVLLLWKPALSEIRVKMKCLTLEKGFRTVVAIWLFTWFNVNHVLNSIWVVLVHRSVPVLIIIKVGREKCQSKSLCQ